MASLLIELWPFSRLVLDLSFTPLEERFYTPYKIASRISESQHTLCACLVSLIVLLLLLCYRTIFK
jgi:hypothetical protein